jgi:DNA-binding transcriptional LysR family regulator
MIRYLRTFIIAAETGAFSLAGAKLGLSQSAVSTQMRRLEDEIGFPLFERSAKAITLSSEGRLVVEKARAILELYESLSDRTQYTGAVRLNIGAISTVQGSLLPGALRDFGLAQQNASVNIAPGVSAELLAKVESQELDLAIMVKPRLGLPPDLRWIPLIAERYVAIGPKNAPDDLDGMLRSLPFIRYNRRSRGGRDVERFLVQRGLTTNDILELDEPAVIVNMVGEGLGCSIVPGELVDLKAGNRIKVLPLPSNSLSREIGVLASLSVAELPHVQQLVECLLKQVKKLRKRASTK